MSVSYTCPNPDCGVTLKTPNRVAVGKSVKCPKCAKPFVPGTGREGHVQAGASPATKSRADEARSAEGRRTPAAKKPFADDDDESTESVKKGYGVVAETEEEKKEAEKNKPKFTEVQDKFKKSARGPAQALLVMPSNLLTGEGLLTVIGGHRHVRRRHVAARVQRRPARRGGTGRGDRRTCSSAWCTFVWGALVCFGASQMQELGSYPWAMIGAVMGIVPLLVGIFAHRHAPEPEGEGRVRGRPRAGRRR